jgi:uncharacterized protein YcbX
VLSGGAAFAEDGWRRLRIGAVPFRAAKPCGRCLVINVDPETAVRGAEPLRTLASFRTRDGSALFGVNLVHEATGGTVAVGDAVQMVD